jgi:hypothetical protein
MRWLRLYDDTINDPKILKLPEATRWHWIAMLCIASKNDGVLPALDDVSIQLRVTAAKATEIIAVLVKAGLIDKTETGFAPHNWSGRQYHSDSSAERMRRHRDRKKASPSDVTSDDGDGGGDVTVTLQIQNTETDTETEKKKDSPLRSDDWPKDYGDQFWQAYPRKTEKLSAMKKLATLRKSGIVTFADLMAGVKRYAAAGTEPQYTKHPTTWLNAGCWADEPQTGGGREGTRNTHKTGHDAMFAVLARKAREIAGDGEMAGAAGESELPIGNGTIRPGAQRPDGTAGCNPEGHDGGQSGSGRVLEGEVIAPGETNDGLSRNWRHH